MSGPIDLWRAARAAVAQERHRAGSLVTTDDLAFLPAALEIVERPVSPTARATAWTLLTLLALTLLWLIFGKVDVVASASGQLLPAGSVQLVQPAEAGVIRAILVQDGQRVRRGQALVELDPTVSDAEAVQARQALQTAELDAARARAVLGALDGAGLRFAPPAGTPAEVARTQAALARAQLANIDATAITLAADRVGATAAQAEAAGQYAKLTETLPLLDEQIAANETLLAKGYVSKLKVIEMRRQRLAAARDRDIARDTARRAAAQVASAGGGLARARAEARATVLDALSKAEATAQLRREELTKAGRATSLRRLLSPTDGVVAQLAVHTVGGVVEAAKPIMVVVPSGGALVAEVKVLNRDVGFVSPGQEVAVKLEAFPFSRYGTVPGRLVTLSSDASADEKLGLVYTARVALDRTTMARDGTTVPLVPGMVAVADIRTGRRRIMSYLLSPIDDARLSAGRER